MGAQLSVSSLNISNSITRFRATNLSGGELPAIFIAVQSESTQIPFGFFIVTTSHFTDFRANSIS